MQCRRKNVEEALDWLMKYSPAYKGVRKSRENLALLPSNGQLAVHSVVLSDDEVVGGADVGQRRRGRRRRDVGPAPLQRDVQDDAADDDGFLQKSTSGTVSNGAAAAAGRGSAWIFELTL